MLRDPVVQPFLKLTISLYLRTKSRVSFDLLSSMCEPLSSDSRVSPRPAFINLAVMMGLYMSGYCAVSTNAVSDSCCL